MEWTTPTVLYVSLLFFAAGLAEIGGGWLVWQAARENQPRWWAVAGSIILMIYGFLPTLQPLDDFGRLYAVYGGVFIGMSFAWGYLVDGIVPDRGLPWQHCCGTRCGDCLVLAARRCFIGHNERAFYERHYAARRVGARHKAESHLIASVGAGTSLHI